jgi:hypothetical protein
MVLSNPVIWKAIPSEDKKLLVEVNDLINKTRDYFETNAHECLEASYRCHSICRAIGAYVRGVKIVDGFYFGLRIVRDAKQKPTVEIATCDHTWLTTRNGTIIDPYPVGCLNLTPLLVPSTGRYRHYGRALYKRDKSVTAIATSPEFTKETIRLKEIIGKASKT